MANKMIQIDGSQGGGQMLRTALTLAMITGKPFRMTHIRGQRRKPGLMRQHLTCVKAACEISGGIADGAEIGSTELVFRADRIQPGDYEFAIGTAGSTGLLLQTLLPALWHAEAPSTLRLSGGTHNPLAPPFDFLERCYLPAMKRMGAEAELRLIEAGFAPAGGGVVDCTIDPCKGFKPIELAERGENDLLQIRIPFRNLSAEIAQRILKAVLKKLPCEDARIHQLPGGVGQGVAAFVDCGFGNTHEVFCEFGERGVTAEKVGKRLGGRVKGFLASKAAVGPCLADQLLLPMALAGSGCFTTVSPDNHVPSNIATINQFVDTPFKLEELTDGLWQVTAGAG